MSFNSCSFTWLVYLHSVLLMLTPIHLAGNFIFFPTLKILPSHWLFSVLLKQLQWYIFTWCKGIFHNNQQSPPFLLPSVAFPLIYIYLPYLYQLSSLFWQSGSLRGGGGGKGKNNTPRDGPWLSDLRNKNFLSWQQQQQRNSGNIPSSQFCLVQVSILEPISQWPGGSEMS